MSMNTYLFIHTQQDNVPELFARIYRRLFSEQTDDIRFRVVDSVGKTETISALSVVQQLPSFIQNTIFPAHLVSTVQSGYVYPAGDAYLGFICEGPTYYQGIARDNGYLQLKWSAEAFLNLHDDTTSAFYPPAHVCNGLPGQLVTPLELLICRILGIDTNTIPDPAIEHLMVMREGIIGGIEASTLVYHQDQQALLRDLSVSYAQYHWGLGRQIVLEHNLDVWGLTEADIHAYRAQTAWKERPPHVKNPDAVHYWQFLAQLAPNRLRNLESFSGSLDSLLNNLSVLHPEVRHYAIADHGILISFDPSAHTNNSLWQWYADLMTLAIDL